MEIKAAIPNSEYSITMDGLIVDGSKKIINPYRIPSDKKIDYYDLQVNGTVTTFSHREIIKRVVGIDWYNELRARLRTARRAALKESERLRIEHRAAVLAQPDYQEFKIN